MEQRSRNQNEGMEIIPTGPAAIFSSRNRVVPQPEEIQEFTKNELSLKIKSIENFWWAVHQAGFYLP